jgi:hypothetical protein
VGQNTIALAALALLVPLAVLLLRREWRALQLERAAFFRDCSGLGSAAAGRGGARCYPSLEASRHGLSFRARPFVHDLAVRKLPQLLMAVTVMTPLPVAGSVGAFFRPDGSECYSLALRLPQDWTRELPVESAVVRASTAAGVESLEVLQSTLAALADLPVKELVFGPQGAQLILLLDQGERAHYGVFRSAAFGVTRCEPAMLERCITVLSSLVHGARSPALTG